LPRIVIADTNVLTDPAQSAGVRASIANGVLSVVAFETTAELATYAALRRIMGQGEAAALALAEQRHFAIASDEKRVFRREAIARLGTDRLVTTADVFVACIRAGAITIGDADAALRTLVANRFTLPFASFRDVL
jgi:predicted nucleic acid-binding protein